MNRFYPNKELQCSVGCFTSEQRHIQSCGIVHRGNYSKTIFKLKTLKQPALDHRDGMTR